MDYESLPDLAVRLYVIADDRLTERPILGLRSRGSFCKIVESLVNCNLQRSVHMEIRQLTPGIWLLQDRDHPIGIFVSDTANFFSVCEALRGASISTEFFYPVLTSGLAV